MVTTRSKGAQTRLEDFSDDKPKSARRNATKPKADTSKDQADQKKGVKRKAPTPKSPAAKQTKISKDTGATEKTETTDEGDQNDTVVINRAPVLHLFAACVAHRVHPELTWETCLSCGSAISTICAVAKGRSIGTVEPPDEQKKAEKETKRKKQKDEFETVQVMQFKLKLKDGLALVGSTDPKGKPGSEGPLKGKFGDKYVNVKKAFDEVLENWKGHEDELNEKAFGFYEELRPTVGAGQKAWGRKAELSLKNVNNVISRRG